jgi:hypothetical protein
VGGVVRRRPHLVQVDNAAHATWWQWLIDGPLVTDDAPAGFPIAAVLETAWLVGIARLVDNPEIVATDLPAINLQTP